MIPTDLQAKLDALVANLLPPIAAHQSLHLTAHGRCWQGRMTHAAVPVDGATAAPNLDAKPTDETSSWREANLTLPAQSEAAFSVEAYRGPQGPGYVLYAHVIAAGVRYRRAINSGPEPWRTQTWTPVKTTNL